MRHLVVLVAGLLHLSPATAAIPANAEEEVREGNRFLTGPDHLQPQGSSEKLQHGCVVEFQATDTMPPFWEDHWCLIEGRGSYEIRSWRRHAGMEGSPDNPATPQNESLPDIPFTEQDVLLRDFPLQLGIDLRQLWLRAIMESRYPASVLGGLDGATYKFTVSRYASDEFISADVWFPSSDRPPTWMVHLGSRIYAVAAGNRLFDDQLVRETVETRQKLDAFYAPREDPKRLPIQLIYAITGAALLISGAIVWRRRHAS